jgi:hypothetical protein
MKIDQVAEPIPTPYDIIAPSATGIGISPAYWFYLLLTVAIIYALTFCFIKLQRKKKQTAISSLTLTDEIFSAGRRFLEQGDKESLNFFTLLLRRYNSNSNDLQSAILKLEKFRYSPTLPLQCIEDARLILGLIDKQQRGDRHDN